MPFLRDIPYKMTPKIIQKRKKDQKIEKEKLKLSGYNLNFYQFYIMKYSFFLGHSFGVDNRKINAF